MKKLLLLLCSFCGILQADNLIKNGQFTEQNADGSIAHWKIWPAKLSKDAEVALDSTVSRSGGRSVRITNRNPWLYTRVDQLRIPCKPHTRYIASCWVKGKDIHTERRGGARMFIGPHGDLQYPITQFGPGLDSLNNQVPDPWTHDWKHYESNVFNSGDSRELGVTLYLNNAAGTVWFDNVEIYEYTPELKQVRQASRARQLIRNDIKEVRSLAPELSTALGSLEKEFADYRPAPRDPRKGMPFFAPQRKLGVLFSGYLRKKFPGQELILSPVGDPLAPQSSFWIPAGKLPETITLRGLGNEPESFAVNVTNAATEEKILEFQLPQNLNMTARLAVHVETDALRIVDDALVKLKPAADGKYRLHIPAGMTRQLYFTAELKQPAAGMLELGNRTFKIELMPVRTALPEKLPILSFSYAYLDYPHYMAKRFEATRAMMKNMHDNLVHPYQFHSPLPVFNENGDLCPEKMDWSRTDRHLAMKAQPASVMIVLPVKQDPHLTQTLGKDHGKPIVSGSPEWERRLILWIRELVRGFRERGIGYDRLYVNFCDEPSEKDAEYIVRAVRTVRKADPKLQTCNNYHYALSAKSIQKLGEVLDILDPELETLNPAMLKLLHNTGKELWVYHVQNRNYPADRLRYYFRMLKREGFTGYSYWCFADRSPDWEPSGSQSYSVVYSGDPEEWIPSKRSEAIKDGLEDYTLLWLLEKKNRELYQQLVSPQCELSRTEWRKQALAVLDELQKGN